MIQFLQLFTPEFVGLRMCEAAEAFDTPPLNRAARRYGGAAICFLLAGAALLLTAALVDWLANARGLSEGFGWAGIACLNLSVYCGLRYKAANAQAQQKWPRYARDKARTGAWDSEHMPS